MTEQTPLEGSVHIIIEKILGYFMKNFVNLSLETHLFFARIMKEHAIFLEAGLPCKDTDWIKRADCFRKKFEMILREAIQLGDGNVGIEVLQSGELTTEFTIAAERRTQQLTGIPIDSEITRMEQNLRPSWFGRENREIPGKVEQLNRKVLRLLEEFIDFKKEILIEVKRGRLFNANYPLLVEHIRREAMEYRRILETLMEHNAFFCEMSEKTEDFWNRIMMEHGLFIRGTLDPSEEALVAKAQEFALAYRKLLEEGTGQSFSEKELTEASLAETLQFRDFKEAGTKGILECKVLSVILPLLADHVLREANHYIRLLREE